MNSLRASVSRVSCMQTTPVQDDAVQLRHAVSQSGRAGLQDVSGFDFKQLLVFDRVDVLPTGARRHFFRSELLAAPGADDDVGVALHDLSPVGNDAVLAQ